MRASNQGIKIKILISKSLKVPRIEPTLYFTQSYVDHLYNLYYARGK